MRECDATGCERTDSVPFICNECGNQFCPKHRLPENHSCHPIMQSNNSSGKNSSAGVKSKDETKRGRPNQLANRPKTLSSKPKRKTDQRFWTTWLTRLVGLVFLFSLLTILLVGFTPTSMPNGVPPEVAEPVEEVGAVASSFVANLTDTSQSEGTSQHAPTKTPSEGSNLDGQSTDATTESDTPSTIDVGKVERLIHQNVNSERQSQALETLSFDSDLQEIARYHSEDMAKVDYFAHNAPDGETMEDRYENFNYQCRVSVGNSRYITGAENIFSITFSGTHYSEQTIAKKAVDGWMDSEGHRENILKENWKKEGIGVYIEEKDEKTKVYVTQNFC